MLCFYKSIEYENFIVQLSVTEKYALRKWKGNRYNEQNAEFLKKKMQATKTTETKPQNTPPYFLQYSGLETNSTYW